MVQGKNYQRASRISKHKHLKKKPLDQTEPKKRINRGKQYTRLFCATIQNHMIINIPQFKLRNEWKGKNNSQQPELYTFLKNYKGKLRSFALFYIVFQHYERDSAGNLKGPKKMQQYASILKAYEKYISDNRLSPQQVTRQKKLLRQVLKLSRLNEFRFYFNLELFIGEPAIRLNDPTKRLRVIRNKDKDLSSRYKGSKNFHKLIKQFKGKQLSENRVEAEKQYDKLVSFWQDLKNEPFENDPENMPEPVVAGREAQQNESFSHQSGQSLNDLLSTEVQIDRLNSTSGLRVTSITVVVATSEASSGLDEDTKNIQKQTFDGIDDWTRGGWKECLQ